MWRAKNLSNSNLTESLDQIRAKPSRFSGWTILLSFSTHFLVFVSRENRKDTASKWSLWVTRFLSVRLFFYFFVFLPNAKNQIGEPIVCFLISGGDDLFGSPLSFFSAVFLVTKEVVVVQNCTWKLFVSFVFLIWYSFQRVSCSFVASVNHFESMSFLLNKCLHGEYFS